MVSPPRTAVPEATARTLSDWVVDTRRRTLDLLEGLSDADLLGPRLAIVNPLLWELGHLAWFQEKWVLRRGGRPSIRADADALYDSAAVPHDVRWDLPLPDRAGTLAYMADVHARVLDRVARGDLSPSEAYFLRLVVFHEDMHDEAFAYTRQTLGQPAPRFSGDAAPVPPPAERVAGDVRVPGGTFLLGASRVEPFVFDNEKWEHPVELRPFRIARAAVTQEEFARFVDDGGYRRDELWSVAGRRWREAAGADAPMHWRREGGRWLRRDFHRWVPLEPRRPVVHVGWFEADAWCRWAGRRLPTEAEWEAAAAAEPDASGGLSSTKRRFPWGDELPSPERANLDGSRMGCCDVDSLPDGDSAFGCRQMFGNVWEWCADDFRPYPGFVVDPYEEYSEPWFGTHKVLRGGCWVTRGRLLRNTWRNFYTPDRRDVWAGFRTCAADGA